MPSSYFTRMSQIAYVNTPAMLQPAVNSTFSTALRGGVDNLKWIRSNTNDFLTHGKHTATDSTGKSVGDGKTSLYNSDGTKKRRIAYAITISKDGSFQDGAAILAYSIYESSKNFNDVISFVAFVHPNVITSRPALKRLGFHVIEGETNMTTTRGTLHPSHS
jgi:predicted esterase